MKTLEGNADEGLKLLKSGIRTSETPKTAGEYAALNTEQENAFLRAQGLPTAKESMKKRLDSLAAAGKEARNNRDVDRWMAVAQGFFAMAGGKSQYAMQNMAEGLNMGVKELRSVEQEYRKIDQLQKDKAALLEEAIRQEARGDFAKGNALRKEAEDRKDKIEASNLVVAERLLHYSGDAMGRAISAKGLRDTRKDAAAGRIQAAGIAAQERKDKSNSEANQKFADMQVRLTKQHPLMIKGTLPEALTTLENARLQLAKDPSNANKKRVNDLVTRVDAMQDQIANDVAKDAARFIKAGNSAWGALQTTEGKK